MITLEQEKPFWENLWILGTEGRIISITKNGTTVEGGSKSDIKNDQLENKLNFTNYRTGKEIHDKYIVPNELKS